MVRKGVTAAEHIEGCLKVRESGISPSVYIMPGLGGASLSEIHAHETARVITEIQPDFVRIRSLEIFPGTPLDEMRASGEFEEASEESVVREIRTIVEKTNCRTVIMSDSASNLIQVNGNLPDERQSMLNVIDSYLELPRRKKLEFSLRARLGSFMGQYGELTDDIISALVPMIKGGTLDFSSTGDVEIETATRLIRGKLMP
jgi:radical SAM superfamily enzyme